MNPLTDPFFLIEVIGIIAFAISGGAVAVRAGMDWVGITVLAVITAVGGGTLRDLLMGHGPVSWLLDSWPLWVSLVTAILVIIEAYRHPRRTLDNQLVILVADAAGLAVFSVAGTGLALGSGIDPFNSVILGVITGVGGGVIRDLLARQRPLVLVSQIYALTSVAGGAVYVGLDSLGVTPVVVRWTAVTVGLTLRLVAIRFGWSLPHPPAPASDLDGRI
ncbi:MAG: trimeric intracellular cation channel family protein [Propionibacterium sp.]